MSIQEAKELEKRQAAGCDYYAVFLKNEATDEIIRVRTPVHKLDGERRPIMDGDRKVSRDPHEVALDVWAAYGADEHTLEMVLRGGLVVATARANPVKVSAPNPAGSLPTWVCISS